MPFSRVSVVASVVVALALMVAIIMTSQIHEPHAKVRLMQALAVAVAVVFFTRNRKITLAAALGIVALRCLVGVAVAAISAPERLFAAVVLTLACAGGAVWLGVSAERELRR